MTKNTSVMASGYRSIAVHLKAYEQTSEHIEVAMRLAQQFDAALTGILTQRDISVLKKLFSADTIPVDRLHRDEEVARETERQLMERGLHYGLQPHFEAAEGDAAEILSLAGRFHDLVVVEQTDHSTDEIGFDVPEYCVANTGRAVLVVPYKGVFPTVGKRILVAWNASREASLAVQHALPLIRAADEVLILEGASKEPFPSVTKWPKVDIEAYLKVHNENAMRFTRVHPKMDSGAMIADAAAASDVDLIVMGAYGRSRRFSEWLLGGATKYLLRNTEIPLLMAN
ncbi:MAG: universal stress protein [Sphingorhabdus sp.]